MKDSRIFGLILTLAVIWLSGNLVADDLFLTVYNSNLGVVREVRNLQFEQGNNLRFGFTDVASSIDATSVTFELADSTLDVAVLEQNYAYDLVSPQKIYEKYIDSNIDIITEKGDLFSGTLLSFQGGYLVIKAPDGRIKSISAGQVRDVTFPELPEGLITRPTLFWRYNSGFAGPADAIVSYQTTGINWNAEYVGVLSEDEKQLDLTGWVSIDNRSGKTYKDAKLKVVAGDISRVYDDVSIRRGTLKALAAMPIAEGAGFEEKAFFEYHLYTLPRRATLANMETKQISMFDPTVARVEKELRYSGNPGQRDVKVYLKTKNSEENGLGMPLPAGRVRVFKADSDKSLILLGEDRIGHTPRNEEVKLTIGTAFDIVGETVMVARRSISEKVSEQDFRIEVRNQKENEPVTVVVYRSLGGFWEITNSSVDYVKKSAGEVEWTLDIAPDEKAVIDYTVRYTQP